MDVDIHDILASILIITGNDDYVTESLLVDALTSYFWMDN